MKIGKMTNSSLLRKFISAVLNFMFTLCICTRQIFKFFFLSLFTEKNIYQNTQKVANEIERKKNKNISFFSFALHEFNIQAIVGRKTMRIKIFCAGNVNALYGLFFYFFLFSVSNVHTDLATALHK